MKIKYLIMPAILIICFAGCSKNTPEEDIIQAEAASEANIVNSQPEKSQVSDITKVGEFPNVDEIQEEAKVIGFEYVSDVQWKIARDFSEGLAAVGKDGVGCGYIDKNGNFEIGPNPKWNNVGSFTEGLARIRIDGKWGYINRQGEIVIPCEWDRAYEFSEGLACVFKDKNVNIIDTSGKIAIPLNLNIDTEYANFLYETSESIVQSPISRFSSGLAQINSNYFDGKLSGFVNTSGEILLSEYKFLYVGLDFSEGLLPARMSEGELYGFVDSSGAFKIEPKWIQVEPFYDGVAWVRNDEERGFIDKSGNMIFRFPENKYSRRFSEGKAWVFGEGDVGFINTEGKLTKTDEIEPIGYFASGLCPIGIHVTDTEDESKGHVDTLGYIDKTGELVIPSEWDSVGLFSEGIAIVTIYEGDSASKKGYIRAVTG